MLGGRVVLHKIQYNTGEHVHMPNIHNNCLAVTACNRINEMNTCSPIGVHPSTKRNPTKVPFYLIISKLDHQLIVIMVRYVDGKIRAKR